MVEKSNLNNIYKIYQLMDFFVTKYSFYSFVVKEEGSENEIWLANPDNKVINIIRLSLTSLDETYMDKNRIENIVSSMNKVLKEPQFLDLHISKEEVGDTEFFNTLCLETGYHSGYEANSVFPGLYEVVHESSTKEEEIRLHITNINSALRERLKIRQLGKKINKIDQKIQIPVTYGIIIICTIIEIIYYYLTLRFGESDALYYLGADYYPLTVYFGQYWRLITYGFLHGGLLHLVLNMYSLYIIGSLFERSYGKLKYILIILTGILIGGLTHDIMSKTTVSVGFSAAIYSLFTIYIINAWNNGAWRNPGFMMMIVINIMLNFMSGIAWQAHLGGAIVGFIYYMMFKDGKPNGGMIVLLVAMILAMFIKLLMVG